MLFRKKIFKKTESFFHSYLKKGISNPSFFSYFQFLVSSLFSHPFWMAFQRNIEKSFFFVRKHWKFFLSLFIAFLISDLLIIRSYSLLIPSEKLPPLSFSSQSYQKKKSSDYYKSIWEKNIFHTGPIPLQLKRDNPVSLNPVKSSLPFELKGTIIHVNPRRSVATITAGLDNKTLSYQQGDEIEKQAEIRQIQRAKVVFFNQNNNRLEYILIPEKKKSLHISYQKEKGKRKPILSLGNSMVEKKGSNNFRVKRSNVNEYLQKLPEILMQARVVPNRSKKTGEMNGFRFENIDKDSVFEDLGFEVGDVIKEVDGEFVSSPEQAIELFDRLKGSSGFKILVEKKGKDVYYEYNVNENAPIK